MWLTVREIVGAGLGSSSTLLLALVLLLFILQLHKRPKNFPPGLPVVPVLGSLPFTGFNITRSVLRPLRKRYGDLASLSIFNTRLVLVSNFKTIKEVFGTAQAAGRPEILFTHTRNKILTDGRHTDLGILASSGQLWHEQRRFVLRHLRDLGFGKTSLEPLMLQEIQELVSHLESLGQEPLDMSRFFGRSIINLIWGMVMGKRYPYGHEKLGKLLQTFITPADINLLSPIHFIPGAKDALRFIPLLRKQTQPLFNVAHFIKEEMRQFQQERGAVGGRGDECLAAVYMREIEEHEGEVTNFHADQLLAVIFELFVAGSETTSSTLTMALYLVAKHPHVMARLHQELDQVVARPAWPSFQDMDRLPYTQAAIHEVQRIFRLVPYSLPHISVADITVNGYDIPKGTLLIANMDDCLMDPGLWKNPGQFDPENFLDDQGRYKRNDAFMPFGSGKRQCVGEPLARLELFLFFACLVHRFSFTVTSETHVKNDNPLFTPTPKYTVVATPRP